MRVQFTNKENEIIEGKSYDAYIPFGTEIITAGLKVTDPYKFNMFIAQYLQNPDIANQIGAELVHVDLCEPITRDKLIPIHNCLGNMIYGEKIPEAPQEEESVESPEEYSDDDNDGDYGEE